MIQEANSKKVDKAQEALQSEVRKKIEVDSNIKATKEQQVLSPHIERSRPRFVGRLGPHHNSSVLSCVHHLFQRKDRKRHETVSEEVEILSMEVKEHEIRRADEAERLLVGSNLVSFLSLGAYHMDGKDCNHESIG